MSAGGSGLRGGGAFCSGGGGGGSRGGGSADPPLFSVPPRSPGNVPGRLQAWPRRAPPVSLAFLEAVLSHVGLSEVHKAIALFLDAPPAMGGPQHTQRYPTTLRPPVPNTPPPPGVQPSDPPTPPPPGGCPSPLYPFPPPPSQEHL